MKTLVIAGTLLITALLAAPAPASANGFVSFGWNRPAFGYGCGRPSYWGAPPIWAGAYRPYTYPGFYYAPRPYGGAYVPRMERGAYVPRPYPGAYAPRTYPLFGAYPSYDRVPVPQRGYGGGSYYGYR